MESNLSELKRGDWVWTVQDGWVEIITKTAADTFDVILTSEGKLYYMDGRYKSDDKHPSLFIKPPAEFNASPRPIRKVKKWQWVCLTAGGFNLITGHMAEQPDSHCEAIKLPWTEVEFEEEVKDE
jgi:hypothetical protein